jgi:hypothetical protein
MDSLSPRASILVEHEAVADVVAEANNAFLIAPEKHFAHFD